MKKFLVPLMVVLLLVVPMLVPRVDISKTSADNPQNTTAIAQTNAQSLATNTATTFDVPYANLEVSVSQGGEAQAWNLVYELCRAGIDEMCDLYWHGQDEGWWN